MRRSLLATALCAAIVTPAFASGPKDAPTFDPKSISNDIRVLSSDEFEGRGPATAGETKTVNWLIAQLKAAGIGEPGIDSRRQLGRSGMSRQRQRRTQRFRATTFANGFSVSGNGIGERRPGARRKRDSRRRAGAGQHQQREGTDASDRPASPNPPARHQRLTR